MFVGDDPCSDVGLDEAIDNDTAPENHTMIRLPGNQEGQGAVVAVCIAGVDKLCCDDYFLSLLTAEDRLQTRNQHRNLVIDWFHLDKT